MRKGVLLVDDDPYFLSRLRGFFAGAAYRTFLAATADEAVLVLEQHHNEIDLVVLDLCLPGMSGFEIMGLLRRRPSPIKILCTTSVFRDDFLYITTRMGADAALRKPSETGPFPQDWRETVQLLLREGPSTAAPN